VAGGVVHAQVSLGLHDDAGGYALGCFVHEDAAQKVNGDLAGIALVKAGL
jgi:hypothetical protein